MHGAADNTNHSHFDTLGTCAPGDAYTLPVNDPTCDASSHGHNASRHLGSGFNTRTVKCTLMLKEKYSVLIFFTEKTICN